MPRNGRVEIGPMTHPLGRGRVSSVFLAPAPILAARCFPIRLGLREVRRRVGDRESGRHEILVRDPDG